MKLLFLYSFIVIINRTNVLPKDIIDYLTYVKNVLKSKLVCKRVIKYLSEGDQSFIQYSCLYYFAAFKQGILF